MGRDEHRYGDGFRRFSGGNAEKRFRKGLHLFNLHSWAPWDFNPFHIADENRIDISFGATVMSQNLLSSTFGYLAYGYAPDFGSRLRGGINYYGLAPKFELSFEYGWRQAVAFTA